MGEPQDVEGECNAHLYIADNYGDNHATMRCGLPAGHGGIHREAFRRKSAEGGLNECVVTWERDERCRHDWVVLDTDEGKELYMQLFAEESGSPDPLWIEEYARCLESGDRHLCRGCGVTVEKPTARAYP